MYAWRCPKAFIETAAGDIYGQPDEKDLVEALTPASESIYALMMRFESQDPRNRKCRHRLSEVLTCLIMGLLAGRCTQKHSMQWCRNHIEELKKYMELANGIASAPTTCRMLQWVDEKDLEDVYIEWASTLVRTAGAMLIIDGKGLRAGTKKIEGERTPYHLNFIEASTGICVATIHIVAKENEKTAFHQLLEKICIEGSLLTADAMATDQFIMRDIIEHLGDFIFQVKKNNPEMYRELFEQMDRLGKEADRTKNGEISEPGYQKALESYSNHATVEENGGRKEYRECQVTNDVSLLTSTQDKHEFLHTIGVIEQVRIPMIKTPDGNDITPGIQDYLLHGLPGRGLPKAGDGIDDDVQRIGIISSLVLTADESLDLKRKYWIIENGVHYVLDNTFLEDRDTATVNRNRMTILRRFAHGLTRVDQIRGSPGRSSKDVCYDFCDHLTVIAEYIFSGIRSFY